MANIVEYSSKTTAIRGFCRATKNEVDPRDHIFQTQSGKWAFDADKAARLLEKEEAAGVLQEELLETEVEQEVSQDVEEASPEIEQAGGIKRKSDFDGAIMRSWEYYTNNPDLRRKDAIAGAVSLGVAYYTARTQYQKWFTVKKTTRLK